MPVLEKSDLFLLMPTQLTPIMHGCPSPEAAASFLRQVAPPANVEIAFVLFGDETFELRQRSVKALQNEGYTNIESIDPRSVELSASIYGLPLNCAIGEPVFISTTVNFINPFVYYLMFVIQKCENGWQILDTLQHPATALSRYPSARNIVIYKNSPKSVKAEVRKLFPGLKLHFSSEMSYAAGVRFMTNRVYKENLNGYEVLPFCDSKLTVHFANKLDIILFHDRVPPFTVDKEIDIGDAPEILIYGDLVYQDTSSPPVKRFDFENKAFRKVLITVNVDKTLIPSITLKTASTYKMRDRSTPVIYSVRMFMKIFVLTATAADHVSNEGMFLSTADVFVHIVRSSTVPATKAIYFVCSPEDTISQLQEFRDFCAGTKVYPEVKFIFHDSLNLSFTFDRAGVLVMPGQTVTVMSPGVVYVVHRDGKFLHVRNTCVPQDYDINEYDVDTVIIENDGNIFTQTDLEYLRLKYYPRAVIVIPAVDMLSISTLQLISKYLWGRDNETEYGKYLFNNFGYFDIRIRGDGVSETVDVRFKSIPYTVCIDVNVNEATTLDVIQSRFGTDSELLKKFDVPNDAKAVRFTIRVESACDITVAMDGIDETEVKRQTEKPDAIENPEHSNQKTSTVDLVVQFGTRCQTVTLGENVTPFTVSKEADVGDASEVTVRAVSHDKVYSPPAVKTLKFKKFAFRKVSIIVNVAQNYAIELTLRTASTYKPTDQVTEPGNNVEVGLSQLKLNPPSTTVLTFTSDNLVQINAGKTYTGDKEIPAYVRLQSGRAPEVGQKAFDALKKHPGSVFYVCYHPFY
uniref:DNA helicase n=1 Tax=Panagrellus redivivus TaxID=6233 RepID=A0A7E4ULN9_PANRE